MLTQEGRASAEGQLEQSQWWGARAGQQRWQGQGGQTLCGDFPWELAADREGSWDSSDVWEQVESSHCAVTSGSEAWPCATPSCGLDDPGSLVICYPVFHPLKKDGKAEIPRKDSDLGETLIWLVVAPSVPTTSVLDFFPNPFGVLKNTAYKDKQKWREGNKVLEGGLWNRQHRLVLRMPHGFCFLRPSFPVVSLGLLVIIRHTFHSHRGFWVPLST